MLAHPSSQPHAFIPRPRLSAEFERWRDLRLISVVTPTGYGKSTLAAAWLAGLADLPEPQRPLATWLAVEPDGIAVDVALQRLAEPLRPHLPTIDVLLENRATDRISAAQLAQSLTAQIRHLERHFIVVIDDFHLISDPAVLALVQSALDAAPPNLHLILLSRTRPALHIGKLLLKSTALMLDESHLRLDHDEFLAFVRATRLAVLDEVQLTAIEARCEGWVAALQLLAISLHSSTIGTVDALLGPRSGRLLLEHLEYEVFVHLPVELQLFLVDVAPLPFLTAELVAAATLRDAQSSARLLQQALHANVFLSVVDARSQTRFRFHPLFRELLQDKLLAAANPAAVLATSRRAADWLAAHDEVDAALALLLPAHPAAAADVVAAHLRSALLKYDLASARRWLERLPAALVAAHPRLAVDSAWLAFFAERNDLSSCISRAQNALAATDTPASNELKAEIGALHGISLYAELRVDAARAAAEDARQQPHSEIGLAAGYLHLLDALLRNRPEDLDARLRSVHCAADIFRRLDFAHAAVDTALWPCVLKRRYGDAHGALVAFENALAVMHHFGREHSAVAADVHNQYGEHLHFMDHVAAARTQFECARAVAARIAPHSIAAYHATLGLQLCDLADGAPLPEFDSTDDARRWAAAVTDNLPLIAISAGWLRLLRDFHLGALDRCRQTGDSFGVSPTQLTPDTHELLRMLVLASAVVGGKSDDALEVQLRGFHSEMQSVGNRTVAARAHALLALLLLNRGNEAQARAELQSLESVAAALGLPRLISDFPPLLALRNRSSNPDLWKTVDFGLSRTEARVLQLIAENKSNKEIAETLSVSLNTTTTHIKNLYRKLGVHDRAEAVRVWRNREE